MTTYGPNYAAAVTADGIDVPWIEPEKATGAPNANHASNFIDISETTNVLSLAFDFGSVTLVGPVGAEATIGVTTQGGPLKLHVRLAATGVPVGNVKLVDVPDLDGGYEDVVLGAVDDAWGADLDGVNTDDLRLEIWWDEAAIGTACGVDAASLSLKDASGRRSKRIRNRPVFGTLRRGMGRRLWGRC